MVAFASRTSVVDGRRLHALEAGRGPLVVLVHGFPDTAYAWRHQLAALASAGYHAVALDTRGCGRSDGPDDIAAYRLVELAADVAGMIEAIDDGPAHVVGHDWGSQIAFHAALLHPAHVRSVVGLSFPYSPPVPIALMRLLETDEHEFYVVWFQTPGVEADLESDVRGRLLGFYLAVSGDLTPDQRASGMIPRGGKLSDTFPVSATPPPWLTETDLDHLAGEFERTGFTRAANRYRAIDLDVADLAGMNRPITQPALFAYGTADPVFAYLRPSLDRLGDHLTDLRGVHAVAGKGHWLQQEAPVEVNDLVLDFLRDFT